MNDAKTANRPTAPTEIGIPLEDDQLMSLDAWIKHQPGCLSRPEAVVRLMELGLKGQ